MADEEHTGQPRDTADGLLTQDEWRRLCMRAFENLRTDTTVTMDDVDAILTWCLPAYDEHLAAAGRLLPVGESLRERLERAQDREAQHARVLREVHRIVGELEGVGAVSGDEVVAALREAFKAGTEER